MTSGLPQNEILRGLSRLHRLALVADIDGSIQWMSDDLTDLCGDQPSFRGRSFTELIPGLEAPEPSDRTTLQRPAQGCVHGVSKLGGESSPLPYADVSLFHVQPDRDEEPCLVAVLRARDCAKRHGVGERKTADFLASILDSAPDAVISVDRDGFITYANQPLERITGLRREDFIDRPVIAFLPRSSKLDNALKIAQPGGQFDGEEMELQHQDGRWRWISISARMIRLPGERPIGNVCFIRDVTERKEILDKLERKNDELESYVHSVSHDLRSPLVSLLGFSRLLREDYGHVLDETGTHFLDRIEQAGRTMEALIRDLLELSRIGHANECLTLVDPRAVLLQIQAELKLRLDEHAIKLDIPSSPALVYCDRTRLYQVLSNLLGNAVSHMGPTEDPQISVEVIEEKDCHRITVSDNGRGIDPADQDRIFEVFTSLGRPRTGEAGGPTGIGLAIVRKIVQTHGGRVWIESTPGKGSRFSFTLPCS